MEKWERKNILIFFSDSNIRFSEFMITISSYIIIWELYYVEVKTDAASFFFKKDRES